MEVVEYLWINSHGVLTYHLGHFNVTVIGIGLIGKSEIYFLAE